MQDHLFYRYGKAIYHLRWLIIATWLAIIIFCIPMVPRVVSVFTSTGFSAEQSASEKADQTIQQAFGYGQNKFIVMYTSDKIKFGNPRFMSGIKQSLAGLKNLEVEHEIILPDLNREQVSKDKRAAYAVVLLKQADMLTGEALKKFEALITTPPEMTRYIGGEPVFIENVNKQTQVDLFNADYIAAPITIVMMLIIFESMIGALVPVIVGGGCSLMILCILYGVGLHYPLSVFTLNIALLLGLCLSLDYALFIISRFRYELRKGQSAIEAVAITQATAGKAVFFSGLAVFVSLCALLFFPINILFSVGVGGISAVFVAVVTANVLLPAILAILHRRINLLSIKMLTPTVNGQSPFWRWLVTHVVKRPLTYCCIIIAILLTLSYPVLYAKFGLSDYRILPPHSESRAFFDEFDQRFNKQVLTPVQLIVESPTSIVSEANISQLLELSHTLERNGSVDGIQSIVSFKPELSIKQYHKFYTMPVADMPQGVDTLLTITTRDHLTVFSITSKDAVNSPETQALVTSLRTLSLSNGLTCQVGGMTANNMDVFAAIKQIFPYAMLAIVLVTYFILLIMLRSVFLPLKAILMTMLSLSASYGVLVLVIQYGFLSELLNFEPQGMLDISLLVIIFCALFGFSMDYEVFLLSRIKEHYDETGDTTQSIIFGVEHSSRIITSAALIVIVICCSFMVADVLMVKAFGLGIAVAIFTDAFIIRSLLVPAVMVLMGRWNWYMPAWLALRRDY